MAKFGGWRTMYGDRGKELAGTMEPEVFAAEKARFLESERVRMREVMRQRRARVKADNEERLKAPHGLLPDWPDQLLNAVERWINANANDLADAPLIEIESAVRKYCRLSGVADYERVNSKGLGRYFRSLGFRVVRRNDGMYVCGIFVK